MPHLATSARRHSWTTAVAVGSGLALVGLAILLASSAWAPGHMLEAKVPPPRRPAAQGLPWLSTVGRAIVDERGRAVLLRGFNSTTLLEWPNQPVAPLDETDLQLMQQSGFNVVRLGVAWSRLEPRRGQLDQDYLETIASTVARLNQHRLYVVIDLHVTLAWSPRFGGAGAPDWAAVPLVPDVRWGSAGEWTEAASPAVLAANAYFWLAPDWQADVEHVWTALARRFRDVSGVVGYDLFNEPNASPLPPGVFESYYMWPFYARLVKAVGAVDPNHLFVIEGPLLLSPPPFLNMRPRMVQFSAPGLVYSPHSYVGALVPPLYTDDPTAGRRYILSQAEDARQLPAIAWWGELGVDTGKPYARDWTDQTLDTLDDLQAGWAWWQWRQDWGWGMRDDDGDLINWDFLRHLARPFVAAAPDGVRGQHADGLLGQLTIEVQPDHANLPVSVSWSARTLPSPVVDGACVVSTRWRAEVARLDMTLRPRAGCTIRVSAAPLAAL